jgi:tetratricopeptide (TPR) repeat protein
MSFSALLIVFPVVTAAVIAGILVHQLIGRYIEGSIGAVECVIIVGIFAGLLISILTLKLILAAVLLVALIGMLLLPTLQGRRILRTMYDEQIQQFRNAIEIDPQNLAARARLAEAFYKIGNLDEAITQMSEVVTRSPASVAEAHRLRQFIRDRDERKAPPVKCPSCGQSNPPGRTRCYNCEASLSLSGEFVNWLRHGGAKQVVIAWAITVAVATLILTGLSMLSLGARLVLVSVLFVVAGIAALVHMHMNS